MLEPLPKYLQIAYKKQNQQNLTLSTQQNTIQHIGNEKL